jgi:hypothetical protein
MLGLVLLGAAAALTAAAQTAQTAPAKMMLAEPPVPLLPEALQTGEGHEAGNGAPAWSGVDEPVLVEDGIRRYERGAPPGTVGHAAAASATTPSAAGPGRTVTVYQFNDATGAYAAFTYLRKTGSEHVSLSGVSVVVLDVKLRPEAEQALLKTIRIGLPKVGGPRALSPLLPTFLPEKGLEKDTVKYSLGPVGYQASGGVLPGSIIGFDKAAEVVTAKYRDKGTLSLLLYPTPQIAGAHGREIEAEMNRQGTAAGTVKLRREGPLVLMTTGLWTPAEAKEMVDGIHLRDEVTWSRPMPLEFHAEVQKTYSLLTSIAMFCVLGALAAVVLGLFFGAGRAAIRVMQGKPAASEPEFLRIDLSGRSAPIHIDGVGGEPRR